MRAFKLWREWLVRLGVWSPYLALSGSELKIVDLKSKLWITDSTAPKKSSNWFGRLKANLSDPLVEQLSSGEQIKFCQATGFLGEEKNQINFGPALEITLLRFQHIVVASGNARTKLFTDDLMASEKYGGDLQRASIARPI